MLISREQLQEATASRGSLKLIETLSKGGKGKLAAHALDGAFKLLKGWSITETTGVLKINGSTYGDIGDYLEKNGAPKIWFQNDKPDIGVKFHYSELTTASGKEKIAAFIKGIVKVPKTGPTNPVVGQIYSDKIAKKLTPTSWDQAGDPPGMLMMGTRWVGTIAYEVKAPNGDTFTVPMKLKRNGKIQSGDDFTSAALWKFMYAHGAKEAAATHLGSAGKDAVDKVLRPSAMRTLDGTGTCSVCARNVKLKRKGKGNIVDHGYKIPRWGYKTRGCGGVNWPPFEKSSSGCENYLNKALKPTLADEKKKLKALKRGPAKLTTTDFRRKEVTYKKGEPKYEYELKSQITRVTNNIRFLEQDIKEMEGRIKGWTPQPLPGEIKEMTYDPLAIDYEFYPETPENAAWVIQWMMEDEDAQKKKDAASMAKSGVIWRTTPKGHVVGIGKDGKLKYGGKHLGADEKAAAEKKHGKSAKGGGDGDGKEKKEGGLLSAIAGAVKAVAKKAVGAVKKAVGAAKAADRKVGAAAASAAIKTKNAVKKKLKKEDLDEMGITAFIEAELSRLPILTEDEVAPALDLVIAEVLTQLNDHRTLVEQIDSLTEGVAVVARPLLPPREYRPPEDDEDLDETDRVDDDGRYIFDLPDPGEEEPEDEREEEPPEQKESLTESEVGRTIWQQIDRATKMSIGAREPMVSHKPPHLAFKVESKPHRYVQVAYNRDSDTYDLLYVRHRRQTLEQVKMDSATDVYAGKLNEVLYRMVNK